MGEAVEVGILLVALQIAQLGVVALTVSAADHVRKTGGAERRHEGAPVVEELVAPAAKRAVDSERAEDLLLLGQHPPVVRCPDPVEIWRRQTQHTVFAENPAAFSQKCQGVAVMKMLDEMLGKDVRNIIKWKTPRDVENLIDTRVGRIVDVHPPGQVMRAASDVKSHGRYDVTRKRQVRARTSAVAVLMWGVAIIAAAQSDPYARAESLAAERQFDAAEAEYRQQLASRPGDWRLRLGLARVILWDGRYREADREFAALLAERPASTDAMLGYAQAAYWNGDFRRAEKRYRRLLDADRGNADATKVLADLERLSEPRYEVQANYLDDSQPYRGSALLATVSWFSDPLTRWDVIGSTGRMTGGDRAAASLGAGLSVTFPRLQSTVEARAVQFRFPAGETAPMGELSVTRRLPGQSAVVVSARRTPLLGTRSSVDAHASATQYSLAWRRDTSERWLAAASIHGVRYSDDNEGTGADAWFLAPLIWRDRAKLSAGLSAAWRDTELDRFRFTTFRSHQQPTGLWNYTFTGVYDPYWTPQQLKEGRIVVVAELARFKVHADGGVAKDRAVGFGPPGGTTPTPLFIFPQTLDRSFRPWRVGLELTWPLASRIELRARYRHDVTAFYRANEFEASLGGRL